MVSKLAKIHNSKDNIIKIIIIFRNKILSFNCDFVKLKTYGEKIC